MDETWRFRPPPPAHDAIIHHHHLCPVCSAPHFPFCAPPQPAFDLHRYPPDFIPPMPYRLEPWARSEPFRPTFYSPPARFPHEECFDRGSSYKRMRLDAQQQPPTPLQPPALPYTGNTPPPLPPYFDDGYGGSGGRISTDDERRLNLIRDHGIPLEPALQLSNWGEYKRSRFVSEGSSGQHYGGHGGGMGFQSVEPPLPHERKDFEQVGVCNLQPEGYRNMPYQWKDSDRGSRVGEHHNAGTVYPDAPFSKPSSHRNGEVRTFLDSHGTRFREEGPFSIPIGHSERHDQHDKLDWLPTKDSTHTLPKQPQYPELGSYHIAQDMINYEIAGSLHAHGKTIEDRHGFHQCPSRQAPPEAKHLDIKEPLELQGSAVEQTTADIGVAVQVTSLQVGHPRPSSSYLQATSSSAAMPLTLFPVLPSALGISPLQPRVCTISDSYGMPQANNYNEPSVHLSAEVSAGETLFSNKIPSGRYSVEGTQKVPISHPAESMSMVIHAHNLFKLPNRASRPDHFVIILRGLPGSGKSYLAKAIRDLEVENGGSAPRIHAMDDYFMIEVEKTIEDNESSKSSSASRVKKHATKKVIEYCYEPEMEEAYRSSLLKAFKKTIDEGIFTFVIVDDRNLRVADFAQFWAIAKRSGYEVYLLEAPYRDPMGCAARNVHGFTLDDIRKMAKQWEEAPPLYLKLDIQTLFHSDDLNEHSIQEVDMDTNDSDCDEATTLPDSEGLNPAESISAFPVLEEGSPKVGERCDSKEEDEEEEMSGIKELQKSKWSKDLDDDFDKPGDVKGHSNALSGLIQAYSKREKSVHWGDQVDKGGFSIGVSKKQTNSLIIGPGPGYNLVSNPLVEEHDAVGSVEQKNASESKKRFSEQLRAERESFRSVFDRRRRRIGIFHNTEDDL